MHRKRLNGQYLARSLHKRGCNISLFVLNTSKHFFDPENLPQANNFYHKIYSVGINNDITIAGALKSMIKGESYILSRFRSKEYEEKLAQVLEKEHFDVIQLETIYMTHYIKTIKKHSKAVIAVRAHNVEHLIWERVASMTDSFFKRSYLKFENRSLRKFELKNIKECDILTAITDKDLEVFRKLGFKKESVVAPVGINIKDYQQETSETHSNQSIGFIGALDWMPNQDGIVWFLDNIWPAIENEFAGATFHIAGKNTPDWIFEKATERIIVHGEVNDAKKFISSYPILVAPLFSGSGIKIKILEGMALGRVVVTTSIGAEGINANHKQHLLIADDILSYTNAIKSCFTNKDEMKRISYNGRKFIETNFDSGKIGQDVIDAYKKLIEGT